MHRHCVDPTCKHPDVTTTAGQSICPVHLQLICDFKRWLYKDGFDADRANLRATPA